MATPVRYPGFKVGQQLASPVKDIGVGLILQLQVHDIVEVDFSAEEVHCGALWVCSECAGEG